jgi:hypothetical protein
VKETYRRLAGNYERLAARERMIQNNREGGSGGA